MKKLLTMLLAGSFLVACNSRSDKEQGAATGANTETHQDHKEMAPGLVLNNGAKWKADSTTLLNVDLLKSIVSGAKKSSLEDYTQTATQLQDGIGKMINECKMKGDDHDALHHWLEPLMEKTKELKQASSTASASKKLSEIQKHLDLFLQYFELS